MGAKESSFTEEQSQMIAAIAGEQEEQLTAVVSFLAASIIKRANVPIQAAASVVAGELIDKAIKMVLVSMDVKSADTNWDEEFEPIVEEVHRFLMEQAISAGEAVIDRHSKRN